MKPYAIISLIILAAVGSPSAASADRLTRFVLGFGTTLDFELPGEMRREAISHVNVECVAIAASVCGKEVADGIAMWVEWSDRNTNGFSTIFVCNRSLEVAIGDRPFAEIQRRLADRYTDVVHVIAKKATGEQVEVEPLEDFLRRVSDEG